MTKYDDRARLHDYRAVFGSEEGKRVLADLAGSFHVFSSTLNSDAVLMAAREGARSVVLDILRYLELKPADLQKIHKGVIELYGLNEGE